MNLDTFKQLLAVPTCSFREDRMVQWLQDYLRERLPTALVFTDGSNNVYVTKGGGAYLPCVAAHIDSVQPLKTVRIQQTGDVLTALDHRGCQTGFGADDKAGVFVCLNLLEQCENIKAVFFAAEECGCVGARNALPQFFDDVAYVIEYDCPSRQMLSYSVGGVRLFSNGGSFIQEALPVLNHYGTVHWQHHPYTDVMALRLRFPVSCFNLSCGYYNWHASSEYVKISDVAHAVEQGCTLVETISRRQHSCPVRLLEDVSPHRSITGLRLPEFA